MLRNLMEVILSAAASRQLRKLELVWRQRIEQRLRDYAADPASNSGSVKMMKGDKRMRLRVGDYRIIFTSDGIVLSVTEIGHRRDVYRRQ